MCNKSQGFYSAQPEPVAPTDKEIMELRPQQMRDDLAAAARDWAGFTGPNASSVCRFILNRHAIDHARAVLARWGTPAIQPEPVAPTDEELLASVRHFYGDQTAADMGAEDDLRTARAVLAKWGTPANNTIEENTND